MSVALATSAGLFLLWNDHTPWAAWMALSSIVWLPGLVMAMGSIIAAGVISRLTPDQRASLSEWGAACLREWLTYFRVFVWRQPFRWRACPDPVVTNPTATVVLVHGYLCNRGFWHPWMHAIRGRGWAWRSVNLEPVFGSIDAMVDRFDPVMKQALDSGGPVAVVAHSMGGLVIRAWLAKQPTWPDGLKTCVTIGSPHSGTWVARWAHSEAGRQMQERSRWIKQLSAAEAQEHRFRFLCWRSLTDHVVFPPGNATLSGAENRLVRSAGHVDLAFQPSVMTESLEWVASAFRSPQARTPS